jgi:hypothetical protein
VRGSLIPITTLEMPDHAVRAIADLAHVIRQLWGAPSGTCVTRYPVLLFWTDTEVTRSVPDGSIRPARGGNPHASSSSSIPTAPTYSTTTPASRALTVHATCYGGRAIRLMPGNGSPSTTPSPTRPRPSTACSCSSTVATGSASPRSPAIAAALGPGEKDGTWYLIRADIPSYAFNHQRRLLAGEPGHADEGECELCPVETIRSSTLSAVLRLAERLGADVIPRPVQAARVTLFHMPTCNRILPGSGWDNPPDDPSMARLLLT